MKTRNLFISLSLLLFTFTNICFALTVTVSDVSATWWPRASKVSGLSIAWLSVTIDGITSEDHYKVIQITLQHVTRYEGICGNSTKQDIKDTGLEALYKITGKDLIFTREDNPDWNFVTYRTLTYQVPSDRSKIETTVTRYANVRSLALYGVKYNTHTPK